MRRLREIEVRKLSLVVALIACTAAQADESTRARAKALWAWKKIKAAKVPKPEPAPAPEPQPPDQGSAGCACGVQSCPCGCADGGSCRCLPKKVDELDKPYAKEWMAQGWVWYPAEGCWKKAPEPIPAQVYMPAQFAPRPFQGMGGGRCAGGSCAGGG